MLKMKSNNAITLMSLVIMIIIIIILVGIVLNATLSENGLFKRAKEQKEEQIKAQILEELELAKIPIMLEYEGDTNLENYITSIIGKKLSNKYEVTNVRYLDKENAEIWIDKKYKYTATQIGNNVIINEGGYVGEIPKPEIIVSDEDKWTKKKEITISTGVYTTKYTTDGTMPSQSNGNIYTELFYIDKNCTITVAYLDSASQIVSSETKQITKIDNIPPTVLNINLTPNKKSIKVDITNAQDGEGTNENGKSEIAGYRYKRDNGAWTDWTTAKTYTFDNIYGDLAGVTCTITVETKDNAGNTKSAAKTAKTTCLNTAYYKNTDLNLCVINGRTYKKENSVPALCAVVYWNAPNGNWTNPVLVSNIESGVYYKTYGNFNCNLGASGTVNYGGTTYFWSGDGAAMSDTAVSTSLNILNTPSTRYTGNQYVYALLDRYFQ